MLSNESLEVWIDRCYSCRRAIRLQLHIPYYRPDCFGGDYRPLPDLNGLLGQFAPRELGEAT